MSEKCKHIQALLPGYMAERLETFDVLDVESHVESCEYCRDELINLGEVFEHVRGCFRASSTPERLDQTRIEALYASRDAMSVPARPVAEILPFPEERRSRPRPEVGRFAIAKTAGIAAAILFVVSAFLLFGAPRTAVEPGGTGPTMTTRAPEQEAVNMATPVVTKQFTQPRPTEQRPDRFARERENNAMVLTYLSDYTYVLGAEPVVLSEEPYVGLAGPPPTFFTTAL